MSFAPAPLMSLEAARDRLLAAVGPTGRIEPVSTFEADGRVLAQDLVSALQVPAFDNSAMDGYAVRSADAPLPGAVLNVTQRIAAGHAGTLLQPGQAARIFTGAPVPQGADAVVMQEDVQTMTSDAGQAQVCLKVVPQVGQWIRRSGEDVQKGALVLSQGTRLRPAQLGLAASLGLAQVTVAARPRVALFSTGDELVMPGVVAPEAMPPGAIYNSNRFFLKALLARLGAQVTDCGIVPDRRDQTLAALAQAAQDHDLVLTSGGVSVGEEDHIKPAVAALGELDLCQISMKPGKPFAYGRIRRGDGGEHANFVGLPGNPVSSFVTFLLLVSPLLLRMQGATVSAPAPWRLPAHFDWPHGDKRREFLRVRRNAQGGLDLFPNLSSAVLTSVAWADGLVDNAPSQAIAWGDMVDYYPFSEWLS